MYIASSGFIFLLILERHIFTHSAPGTSHCDERCRKITGWAGAGELSVHSFLDGFAIGIGFQVSSAVGLIIDFAVIFHDFSDGLNTVTIMMRGGNNPRDSLRMLLLDAITPLLGAITTLFFVVPVDVLIILVPFFAGGFLYLGATDLLPGGYQTNPNLKTLALALLGFLVIFIVTRLMGL